MYKEFHNSSSSFFELLSFLFLIFSTSTFYQILREEGQITAKFMNLIHHLKLVVFDPKKPPNN